MSWWRTWRGKWLAMGGAVWMAFGGVGCQTAPDVSKLDLPGGPDPSGHLQPNDPLAISFSGVTNPPDRFDGKIDELGYIHLAYLNPILATGKTTAELQKEIHDLYVPGIFVRLSVNVDSPNRWFYVLGEVHSPSRQVHAGQMTILRAIATAGGFTDFARKTRVQLIRANNKTIVINCEKARDNPTLDLPVYPGDKIYVPRRII
jgi:protein involved in polysaccharide export with SLBB domain